MGMIPGTVLYVYLGSTAKDLAQVFAGNLEGGLNSSCSRFWGLSRLLS
jgi:uncharacterized membrane protein YdjX (TVP38/TMEM64 family)